jgi:hypothetical protein
VKAALDRFLFAEANARSAAFLRIWIGLFVAYAFCPDGNPTPSASIRSPRVLDLYQGIILTPPYWALAMIPLTAFSAGLWSRWTGLVAAVALAPCVPRMNGITSHCLLWFALVAVSLLNSDREWSLRATIGRPQIAAVGPVWPIRLVQCQLSILYLVNAIAKSTTGYLSGGALAAMSQQLPNFQTDFSEGVFSFAGTAFPLWMAATASAAVEYSLGIGFWTPALRWPTAALGVCFHWGLTWIVSIGTMDIFSIGL